MGGAGKILEKGTTLGPSSLWTHFGYKVLKWGPLYQAHPQTPSDSKRAGSLDTTNGTDVRAFPRLQLQGAETPQASWDSGKPSVAGVSEEL